MILLLDFLKKNQIFIYKAGNIYSNLKWDLYNDNFKKNLKGYTTKKMMVDVDTQLIK